MTYQAALAQAQLLRESLLDYQVAAVSIELRQGRAGSGWLNPTNFVGSMGHHIASRRSQGLTPGLGLVKVGRSDLPGPLCNSYGGFDLVARIICMSWANHPGQGGPYHFPAGTVPANNGRPYLFGWEFEGGLELADFTDDYRQFMSRCLAGTLDYLGQPVEAHIEHKTWAPGRKVDRLGYTLEQARAEIIGQMKKGDDTMPLLPLNKGDGGPNHPKRSDVAMLQGILGRAGASISVTGLYDDQTVAAVVGLLGPNRPTAERPGEWIEGNMMDDILWLMSIKAAQSVNAGNAGTSGPTEAQVREWAADEIRKRIGNG
jgi:hypothetical protein